MDLDAVTKALEEEGIAAFVESFAELLANIERKLQAKLHEMQAEEDVRTMTMMMIATRRTMIAMSRMMTTMMIATRRTMTTMGGRLQG